MREIETKDLGAVIKFARENNEEVSLSDNDMRRIEIMADFCVGVTNERLVEMGGLENYLKKVLHGLRLADESVSRVADALGIKEPKQ